jgi:hypothetical protein
MNLAYSNVEVTLSDYYAGDWVDQLDELKINIDERQVIANAGAYALGRKTDDLIITALGTVGGGQTVADSNIGMTIDKVMSAFQLLGAADVPDDGDRYAVVGWKQWSELLQIDEFSNSQYVGADELPFANITQAKRWRGTLWMPHSGLSKDGSDIRSCFWYHKDDPNYRKLLSADGNASYFLIAESIAARAVAGRLADPTGGATHYHAAGVSPDWSRNEKPTAVIGHHIFYKLEA